MACFLIYNNDISITIPKTETIGNVTYYSISVKVGPISWTVLHRYNGFLDLHELLVVDHSVPKDMLPPKKIIGNKHPAFIEARRIALQEYLSAVVSFLKKRMPRGLVTFLNLHLYDLLFLLQEFALYLFRDGEELLYVSKKFVFEPLKLHAISERVIQPCPSLEIYDQRLDFSHVLDFCSQLKSIKIIGSDKYLDTSNIIPNELKFELAAFKAAETLIITNANLANIYGMGTLRETVTALCVKECAANSFADILLCGEVHKSVECITDDKKWKKLVEVNVSQNNIQEIDEFLQLIPNVERLMLSENKISALSDMKVLKKLTRLSICENRIKELDDLSLCLHSIVYLDLSQNQITSLRAFANLKTLEGLDLGSNLIRDFKEVTFVTGLPSIDYLNLTGNPVTTIIDYRVKVLEQFATRAAEICLDNEKPTQKELDTVSVLQALRIVKEGRNPNFIIVPPVPTLP